MNRLLSNAVTSDRAIVGLSLAGITALGWLYLIVEADKMSRMDEEHGHAAHDVLGCELSRIPVRHVVDHDGRHDGAVGDAPW